MSAGRRTPRRACLPLLVSLLVLTGCGGGPDEEKAGLSGGTAESPTKFAKHFESLTGVSLRRMPGDLFGTRLEVSGEPDRFARYGVYSLLWSANDRKKKRMLGPGRPDGHGIYWKRTGTSYSGAKPFGSRLVLRWVGRTSKRVTPQFERLDRVVEAAVEGKSSLLPEEERPCAASGLDPLKGKTGSCAIKGIPVTFTNADKTLSTPALEAQVLGIGETDEFRFKGLAPITANGRFTLVAYRVTNKSPHPMRFLHPQLRLGEKLVPENPDTAFLLPRSRDLPLPPGATLEARAAFDVPTSAEPTEGALVLPAQRDGRAEARIDLAQGWIRLDGAPSKLPSPPRRGRGQGS